MGQFNEFEELLVQFRDERDWGKMYRMKDLFVLLPIVAGILIKRQFEIIPSLY
jgi:hypothetical protein